ncbi:MAG: T9SS sorting signal type C domain-containing protein [Weeksellaceae bacterium]
MKKNLLTIALVAGVLLPASAQWNQVGGTVKVQPNTLKYVTGDYTVQGTSTVSNEGNVNVRGQFNNAADTNHADLVSNFVNEFNSGTSYGQLIVKEGAQALGQVQSNFRNTDNSIFYNQPIAAPFTDVTATDLATMSGILSPQWQSHSKNGVFNRNRYKNPIFTYPNDGTMGIDNRQPSEVLLPYEYHIVNQGFYNLVERNVEYQGNLANGAHNLTGVEYTIATNFDKNKYGEWALTYVTDFAVDKPAGFDVYVKGVSVNATNGYGSNIFSYGNPYTSNLNLKDALPTDGTITHVAQTIGSGFGVDEYYGNADYSSTINIVSNLVNGNWGGDSRAMIVRPFHVFQVKTTGNVSFTLNDSNKTFESNTANGDAISYTARKSNASNDGLFQVNVKIKKEGLAAFSNTFIIANNVFQPSASAGNEAYSNQLNDRVNAIYTLQENAEGSVDTTLKHNKVYINGINAQDYVGKPISIVHQVATPGEFIFEFDLSEDLNNTANHFYFEDKYNGVIEKITPDFAYTFNATESTEDRFAIYWNDTPVTLAVDDTVNDFDSTVVFKDADLYKVRFAKEWKVAEVYVYNMLGQLVHSKSNVNTSVDYVLPLDNASSVYIVKAVSENGETVTKKIIK